ncbi:serine/threonine protein kinase [Streptomycetaceae bacterium NBC_01309]
MTALPRRIPPPVPRSGVVVGRRYRLTELLGSGGTADVFRGVDMRLRRGVAVKVFRPGACAVTAERFCQEAELLGRLTHPALVAVHDVGRHASSVYVVMRLVEGVTLREHILAGPLPANRVAHLGADLASALEHVHAAGVVHRDVKPSNILIGLDGTPHLTDFGISRLIDEPTRTVPGTLVGTIPYLAPEQLLGHGSGPASDIHALGLVLLEALKGEREYPGGPLEAGTARALRPPHIPDRAPAELASAIEAMTRADPAHRPHAAACVHLLATAAAAGRPDTTATADTTPNSALVHAEVRASRSPVSERTAVRRRRHRILGVLGVTLTAGLALGAGGAALYSALDGSTAPDPRDARPAPTSPPTPIPAPPPADTPAPPIAPPVSGPNTATAPPTAPVSATGATPGRGGPSSSRTTDHGDGPRGEDKSNAGKGASKPGKPAKKE